MTSRRAGPQVRSEAARLRMKIMERDNWRCQFCGTRSNLQVHHIIYRSHGGPDSENNLITACVTCHEEIHLCKRHLH
jgi:5-methylcytosine-specific restriction endonuclease McrA